jgi:hypothetical protein
MGHGSGLHIAGFLDRVCGGRARVLAPVPGLEQPGKGDGAQRRMKRATCLLTLVLFEALVFMRPPV